MEKEMKEKNNNSNIAIIIIIFIVACLLGLIIGIKLTSWLHPTSSPNVEESTNTESNKDGNSIINDNQNSDEKTSVDDNTGVKLYGQIDYVVRILGVNGELYTIETNGEKLNDSCDNELLSGATSCSNSAFTVKKLNINTSEVTDVNLLKSATNKGAAYDAFVIYKNGSVQLVTHNSETKNVFKNYQVKSVSESCASNDVNGNCSSASYTLTLKDGTSKKVTSLD